MLGLAEWSWWISEPGSPGFRDRAWQWTALPPTLGGHVLGAWSIDLADRVIPRAPWPGIVTTQTLSAATDSVQSVPLGAGASGGFGGTLSTLETTPATPTGWRTRSVLYLASGADGYTDNGLSIERGDSLRLARIETVASDRGTTGSLGNSGRHEWQAFVRSQWGRHRVEGGFVHRGEALRLVSNEEQSAGGEGGWATYTYLRPSWVGRLGFERAYDHHHSFGGELLESLRDSQSDLSFLEIVASAGAWTLAGRAEVTEAQVRRQGEGAFFQDARWGWATVSASRALGGGRATAALGGGRHGGIDQNTYAPSLEWRSAPGAFEVRAAAARVLWAAWSDLAAGEEPFLQSTWAGTVDAHWRTGTRALRGWVMAGRTEDRAILTRAPIEELWLREGIRVDPDPYPFALAGGEARWVRGNWSFAGEGYGLTRPESVEQARVDPAWGGRALGEYRTGFFGGDLGLRARFGVEAVGARESEAIDPRTIPAYATVMAGLTLTLADATFHALVRNLEDQRRPEPWIDPGTGSEAIGTGVEYRFAFTVRLSN